MIRSYNFTISRAQLAPDGYLRNVMAINDEFPGPLIEANWEVTLESLIQDKELTKVGVTRSKLL